MTYWFRCPAPKREVAGSSLRSIPISRLALSLYNCVALWKFLHDTSATERPFGTIRNE